MKHPKITVVTPVYNTGKYVIEGLESVMIQDYPLDKIQHIIIDDGSSDDSVEVVNNWIKEKKYDCTFIVHEENQGVCSTLNEALDLAEGKYLLPLPDDVWKKDKLKIEITEFEQLADDYAVLYTNVDFCDESTNVFKENVRHGGGGVSGSVFEHMLNNKVFIFGPGAIFKTSCLKNVGGFDPSLTFEDYDIHLRLSRRYKYHYMDHSLTLYRKYSTRRSLGNIIGEKGIDQIEFIKSLVKLLGEDEQLDELILSKVLKKYNIYRSRNNGSPYYPNSYLDYPDLLDNELLEFFKQNKDKSSYKKVVKAKYSDPNTNLSKRDLLYLYRSYFNK